MQLNFKKLIKKNLFRFQDILGLHHYLHPQIYDVVYKVNIKNIDNESQSFFLILPVPHNTENQTLLTIPELKPETVKIREENLYKNKYAIWQIDIKKGESQTFQQKFRVEVLPSKKTSYLKNTKNSFTFDDYKISPELQRQFLSPNKYIGTDDPEIKKIALTLKKDNDVIKTVKNINQFVIDYLDYKNPILGLYSYREALEKKTVDCGGFDTFFVSLCQALGIPARVVCGFLAGYKKNTMHAWAEWMLPNGEWLTADQSIEQLYARGECKKSSKLGFCGSDRIIFSFGCDMVIKIPNSNIDTEFRIDILQNPYIYSGKESPSIEMDIQFQTSTLSITSPARPS